VACLVPAAQVQLAVMVISVALLGILGGMGARAGRAPVTRAVMRVVLLGVAAMLLTIGLGRLFGTTV
jgi:VIT1/CCC1 family predicted Fe2+/Mn2+ transporter